MKYYNELCQPWSMLSQDIKDGIKSSDFIKIQRLDFDGIWVYKPCCDKYTNGSIYRAPMPVEQKEVHLEMSDIKQGDNFRSNKSSFITAYSGYDNFGIQFGSFFHGYRDLMDAGWEIRSIGGYWRPCSKMVDV